MRKKPEMIYKFILTLNGKPATDEDIIKALNTKKSKEVKSA